MIENGQGFEALDLRDTDDDNLENDNIVCPNSERGLLGVAVEPDFGETAHDCIYLYYTFNESGSCATKDPSEPANRVSRFTTLRNKLEFGSRHTLPNNIPSPGGNRKGGEMKFGKVRLLYVSVEDGSAPTEATNPTVNHTFPEPGRFTVRLTVRENLGKESVADAAAVYPGDTPPRPVTESLAAGTTFRVGQSLTATRSAIGAEDDGDGDAATAPTLRWKVRRYHDSNHFRPCSDGASCVAPPREGLYSTDSRKNYLQIRLTVTDSLGLSRTVSRRLEPRTVDVRFETGSMNLKLDVDSYTFRAPEVFTSWEAYVSNVAAGRQRDGRGWLWVVDHRADGGSRPNSGGADVRLMLGY